MKKFGKVILIIVIIAALICGGWLGYDAYLKSTYAFRIAKEETVPNSTYHHNGTWWGYNQSKIAAIDGTVFTYYIDNTMQQGQVANLANPNKAVFLMNTGTGYSEFGRENASRPCNVLADDARNLVYYVIVEPTSTDDAGTMGKIVLYTYRYEPSDKTVEFISKEDITKDSGDNGQIRTGAAIDGEGNIAVAYGGYDSYMYVFVRDINSGEWEEYKNLSNNDDDEMLYPFVILENKDKFHLLAVQDTNINGINYYHYVMLFTYDSGEWSSKIVVDYRDHPIAQTRTTIVEQNEFYMDGGDIHIIIRAWLDENTYRHFVYSEGELTETDNKIIDNKDYYWVKIVKVEDKLYYLATTKSGNITVIDYASGKTVFSGKIKSSKRNGDYIYINRSIEEDIQIMFCTGNSSYFDVDNVIVTLEIK